MVGAEGLVRGATRIAAIIGISPLVIGLTVVAFGTSAPELAISTQSAFQGQADIAVGNVVGSNIFNILVIVGLSAVITPLVVNQQLVRLDVPLLIGISILTWLMAADGVINSWEGLVLFVGLVSYIVFLIRVSRAGIVEIQDEYTDEYGDGGDATIRGWVTNIGFVLLGLVLLGVGSNLLVNGAVALARTFGVSELIIGLTIISFGTSLPEVATSILAAIRGERDIAVGNAVGSNMFNIMAVLGITSVVAPGGINIAPAAVNFDIPVMVAVAVAALPVFFTGYTITRWKGALFVGYYIAYATYLILAATSHDALPAFSNIMLQFVLPITILTVLILIGREFQVRQMERETREQSG